MDYRGSQSHSREKDDVTKFGRGPRNTENYEMYKKANKKLKKVISDAYDDLFNNSGTRGEIKLRNKSGGIPSTTKLGKQKRIKHWQE